MRKDFIITTENKKELADIWKVVKEVIADQRHEQLKGAVKVKTLEKLLDSQLDNGLIIVRANLDDDLKSSDDFVNYEMILTDRGKSEMATLGTLLGAAGIDSDKKLKDTIIQQGKNIDKKFGGE